MAREHCIVSGGRLWESALRILAPIGIILANIYARILVKAGGSLEDRFTVSPSMSLASVMQGKRMLR